MSNAVVAVSSIQHEDDFHVSERRRAGNRLDGRYELPRYERAVPPPERPAGGAADGGHGPGHVGRRQGVGSSVVVTPICIVLLSPSQRRWCPKVDNANEYDGQEGGGASRGGQLCRVFVADEFML